VTDCGWALFEFRDAEFAAEMRAQADLTDLASTVPEEIWDPLVEDYVAMTICVVMPVCEGGVECLYGSDCHLKDQLLHFS